MFKRFFCISSDLSIVFERHLINAVIRQNRRGNVRNVPSFSYSSALLNRTLLPVFNQSAWGVKHSYTHSHLKKRMDAPIQTAAITVTITRERITSYAGNPSELAFKSLIPCVNGRKSAIF